MKRLKLTEENIHRVSDEICSLFRKYKEEAINNIPLQAFMFAIEDAFFYSSELFDMKNASGCRHLDCLVDRDGGFNQYRSDCSGG